MSHADERTVDAEVDWVCGSLDAWPSFDLEYVVESDAAGPERCTIRPREGREPSRGAAWITAERGSFVNLGDCR